MVDEGVLCGDRILVNTKIREALGDEIFQPLPRVLAGHGVAEIFGGAWMIRKMFLHPCDGFDDIKILF